MSPEQAALMPAVSGDSINGLGEASFRRPSVVYWPNDIDPLALRPANHPFGEVIEFFRRRSPAIRDVYMDIENRAPPVLDAVAGERVQDSAERWTEKVKDFVLAHEGELVGVTALRAEWFYEGTPVPELPWVVMIGATMDYERMQHVPPSTEDPVCAIEVGRIYNKVDRVAGRLANWIRTQGWYAESQGGPFCGQMTLIPPAIECGFGELGKHGSLINRRFGSLIRLSAVRTELPLVPDARDVFGADEFCTRCQVCIRACPPGAIQGEKQMVRGERKWYVRFDDCVPYFNEHYGCGICIAVCPFSKPGVAPRMAEKLARRGAGARGENLG